MGTEEGTLFTLAAADLNEISCIKVFQNSGIDLSLCSPDGQWIVVCPTSSAIVSPKVLFCCLLDKCRDLLKT